MGGVAATGGTFTLPILFKSCTSQLVFYTRKARMSSSLPAAHEELVQGDPQRLRQELAEHHDIYRETVR